MRWFARIAVAVTLSVVAVALLTWAGWPRPRLVVTIDAPPGGSVGFPNPHDQPSPPYRLIEQSPDTQAVGWSPFRSDGAEAYWFLAPDGRLLGPWRPGGRRRVLGFDSAGWLLARTPLGDPGYELGRYDPETGRSETLVVSKGNAHVESRLSDDRSTLVFATGDPLAFDVYDRADARKRSRLAFPGRAGGLDRSRTRVAALGWAISPDGRELLLADAWDGAKRLGPPGVEVYEVATGRLTRRLDYAADPAQPGASGTDGMTFSADGKTVRYVLVGRVLSDSPENWREDRISRLGQSWDFATGEPHQPVHLPDCGFGLFERREYEVARHGAQSLWVMPSPTEYRVLGPDGAWLADWHPLPGEFGEQGWLTVHPQPGRPAVLYRHDDQGGRPAPPLPRWLAWFVRPPPDAPRISYLDHDWSAGEFRRVHGVPAGPQTHAVGPHDLAILTQTPNGGTLSLWDLPPPGYPWPWSVPAGVALGVLLTATGVRLRRLGEPRA